MKKILSYAAAIMGAGLAYYAIDSGKLTSKEGKLLGLVAESNGNHDKSDYLAGGIIVTGAWLSGMVTHMVLKKFVGAPVVNPK